jgi:hypothetical protein
MDIDTIFDKKQNKTLETGFRFSSEGFHCGASANGEVDFGWLTGNRDITLGMVTDLDIPDEQ